METIDFEHGISAIDTDYVRPQLDASHLVVRDGRAAFVDTGTTLSVPKLLAALDAKGIARAAVDWIFVTHVHLDHAGGAGALARHLPNAKVVVHPRGARHLNEPGKLIQGTIAVYGEEVFKKLYGDVVPVPTEKLVEIEDGDTLQLGNSTLELIHTPGHALHHYCIVDRDAKAVFSGDTFGISYRVFDTQDGAFIFPATTPVHFDPDAAHASIDRILSYKPEQIFLTHYSRVTDVERLGRDLHDCLDAFVDIAHDAKDKPDPEATMREAMHAYLVARLNAHGCTLDKRLRDTWLQMDVRLNCQGIKVWLDRTAV